MMNTVELPCKIGDKVWTVRCYKGIYKPQEGFVSEMYFLPNMELQIVVKHVGRGRWGEKIFSTYEEAKRKAEEQWV